MSEEAFRTLSLRYVELSAENGALQDHIRHMQTISTQQVEEIRSLKAKIARLALQLHDERDTMP